MAEKIRMTVTLSQARRLDHCLHWILKVIEDNISEKTRSAEANQFQAIHNQCFTNDELNSERLTKQVMALDWAYDFMTQHYEGSIVDTSEVFDMLNLMVELGLIDKDAIPNDCVRH